MKANRVVHKDRCIVCGAQISRLPGFGIRGLYGGIPSGSGHDYNKLRILSRAPLCETCFKVSDKTINNTVCYESELHPGKICTYDEMYLEIAEIVGIIQPKDYNNTCGAEYKACTQCGFEYPYGSGPSHCSSCRIWDSMV